MLVVVNLGRTVIVQIQLEKKDVFAWIEMIQGAQIEWGSTVNTAVDLWIDLFYFSNKENLLRL